MLIDYKRSIFLADGVCLSVGEKSILLHSQNQSCIFSKDSHPYIIDLLLLKSPPNQLASKLNVHEKIKLFSTIDKLHYLDLISNNECEEKKPEITSEEAIICGNRITIGFIKNISQLKQISLEGLPLLPVIFNTDVIVGPVISSQPELEHFTSSILRNSPVVNFFLKKEKGANINGIQHFSHKKPALASIWPLLERVVTESNNRFFFNGNSMQMPDKLGLPAKEKESDKASSNVGGLRICKPETTLSRLIPYINPVTGVITSLQKTTEQDSFFQTYESTFSKPIPEHTFPKDIGLEVKSLGKGRTPEQAKVSAIAEGLERYSAYVQGNEAKEMFKYRENVNNAINPALLSGLSVNQIQAIQADIEGLTHDIPWSKAYSLTEQRYKYIPFDYLYAGTPTQTQQLKWNSNGCAAGNNTNEAILQGILEIVERDAIAMWWYNKLVLPRINTRSLDSMLRTAIEKLSNDDWEVWCLDATHDFKIPVIIAMAKNKVTNKYSFGFGCHFSLELAAERALTELYQLISIRDKHSAPFNFDDLKFEEYLHGYHPTDPTSIKNYDFGKLTESIKFCVDTAKEIGLEIIVKNYDRPEVPLATVKVIVPGACHIWPQFGLERLYNVPVALGKLRKKKSESELNQIELNV